MILIITNRRDFTADFVILELREENIEFFRFNTEDFPSKADFVYSYHDNVNRLDFSNKSLDLSNVNSIWYRRPVSPIFDDDVPSNVQDFVSGESQEALLGLWRTVNCLWVNHPDKNRLAENKIEQIHRANSYGFQIPDTIITNRPESASDFIERFDGKVIVKTLRQSFVPDSKGNAVIYTNIVDEAHLKNIELVKNCPVIFQQFIEKKSDIRVNVFGEDIYATEICSQQSKNERIRTDWRRAKIDEIQHRPYNLSEDIGDKIARFTRSYGLEFGALDFVLSNNNELFFLELNPNGQWGWIEHLTKQPLRKALVKLLTQKR